MAKLALLVGLGLWLGISVGCTKAAEPNASEPVSQRGGNSSRSATGGASSEGGAEGKHKGPPTVTLNRQLDIEEVKHTSLVVKVVVTGVFFPVREVNVAALESGHVIGLGPEKQRTDGLGELRPGRFVTKGETLVELQNLQLRQELQNTASAINELGYGLESDAQPEKSDLIQAQTLALNNLTRLTNLATQRAINERDLDSARAAYAQAVSNYQRSVRRLAGLKQMRDLLQQRVNNLRVVAPFSGRITKAWVEVGSQVRGDAVATLIDDSELEFTFGVPESLASLLRLNQTRVEPDATEIPNPERLVISSISPEVNPQNRTVECKMRFANPPRDAAAPVNGDSPRLVTARAFSTARVSLDVDGMWISAESVRQVDSRDVVLVVGENMQVEERFVQRGISAQEGFVQIKGGLQAGEIVIRGQPQGVSGGMMVKFK